MKLYYVVKFIVSNTVAVAPINWVNEGVCKWPKYKSERFKRAVKNCEEPSNDWQDFDVQTMCLPVTYEKAREKLTKAEICSDLQTAAEEENEANTKRSSRRLRKEVRHYDSSTDETEKDTPKKIKPNKGNKELVAAPKPPSLPVPSPLVAANDMSSDEDTVLKINDNNTTKEQYLDTLQTLLPSSSLPSLTLNSVEKEPLTLIATPTSREKEPQVTPINSQAINDVGTPATRPSSAGSSSVRRLVSLIDDGSMECSPVEREILILLENINNKLDYQDVKICAIYEQNLQRQHLSEGTDYDFEISFPLSTCDHLEKLNSLITENKAFKKALILKFTRRGGLTTKEIIWRIFEELMSPDLQKIINWSGSHGKKEFSSMAVKDVILAAVHKNPSTIKASDNEIEAVIKRFFQLSGDRYGGRRIRQELKKKKITSHKLLILDD